MSLSVKGKGKGVSSVSWRGCANAFSIKIETHITLIVNCQELALSFNANRVVTINLPEVFNHESFFTLFTGIIL
jgi:hypothetical protein